MNEQTVFLATTNPAKRQRLRWLLEGLGVEESGPEALGSLPSVPEEGASHLENACLKATVWSGRSGFLTLATDGGLVIPALGERWKALRTGRFAGDGATDRNRLDRLLELMTPFVGNDRAAYWVEALAVARDAEIVASWQVESRRGLLATSYDPEAIAPGFWAFSLWYLPGLGKAHSELTPEALEGLDDHWDRLRMHVRKWFETPNI